MLDNAFQRMTTTNRCFRRCASWTVRKSRLRRSAVSWADNPGQYKAGLPSHPRCTLLGHGRLFEHNCLFVSLHCSGRFSVIIIKKNMFVKKINDNYKDGLCFMMSFFGYIIFLFFTIVDRCCKICSMDGVFFWNIEAKCKSQKKIQNLII